MLADIGSLLSASFFDWLQGIWLELMTILSILFLICIICVCGVGCSLWACSSFCDSHKDNVKTYDRATAQYSGEKAFSVASDQLAAEQRARRNARLMKGAQAVVAPETLLF